MRDHRIEPPYQVVICAPVQPDQIAYLKQNRCELSIHSERDVQNIRRALASAHGVVTGMYITYDEALLSSCPALRVVGRMGVGVDNIDLEAATRRGVQVVNTPLPIIEPVAEHALALILALTRAIAAGDRNVRRGGFRDPTDAPGPELKGKTLGIVGFGNTGKRLAEIAHLGLEMRIIYHDLVSSPDHERRIGARRLPLDALLEESDVISVHVNLSPETRGLFDQAKFQRMKKSAYFINCSRGPVVDEAALVKALEGGWIAGAGLDVFAEEPPPAGHPLFRLENVVLTPHRGGQSPESLIGCSWVVEDIVRVLKGEPPAFPVNRLGAR